jgi:hypothetical protein
MVAITPTLYLGPAEDAAGRDDMIPVETADGAYTAIRSGFRALLPPGAWREAAGTLERLGASPSWIEERLELAGRP